MLRLWAAAADPGHRRAKGGRPANSDRAGQSAIAGRTHVRRSDSAFLAARPFARDRPGGRSRPDSRLRPDSRRRPSADGSLAPHARRPRAVESAARDDRRRIRRGADAERGRAALVRCVQPLDQRAGLAIVDARAAAGRSAQAQPRAQPARRAANERIALQRNHRALRDGQSLFAATRRRPAGRRTDAGLDQRPRLRRRQRRDRGPGGRARTGSPDRRAARVGDAVGSRSLLPIMVDRLRPRAVARLPGRSQPGRTQTIRTARANDRGRAAIGHARPGGQIDSAAG